MGIPFPDLQPSEREFVAPRWPTSGSRSQSGVRSKRLWGSKAADGELQLGFTNISDELADQIIDAYDNAKGDTLEVDLPASIFSGTTGSLRMRLLNKLREQGLRWFFKENDPPVVRSVVPGISTVRVNLSAELRLESN